MYEISNRLHICLFPESIPMFEKNNMCGAPPSPLPNVCMSSI